MESEQHFMSLQTVRNQEAADNHRLLAEKEDLISKAHQHASDMEMQYQRRLQEEMQLQETIKKQKNEQMSSLTSPLQKQLEDLQLELSTLRQEHEDLLLYLADHDEKVHQLTNHIRQYEPDFANQPEEHALM